MTWNKLKQRKLVFLVSKYFHGKQSTGSFKNNVHDRTRNKSYWKKSHYVIVHDPSPNLVCIHYWTKKFYIAKNSIWNRRLRLIIHIEKKLLTKLACLPTLLLSWDKGRYTFYTYISKYKKSDRKKMMLASLDRPLLKIIKKNYLFSLCSLFPTTYFDQISPNLWPK